MNISAFHLHIKQKLDKTSSLELPAFESEEIDFWINDTTKVLIEQTIDGVNPQGTGVEETQKRIDDIRTLVVSGYNIGAANANSYYDNDTCFDLPTNYFRYLGDQVTITVSGTSSKVGTTPTTADRFTVKIKDPFSEHNLHHQTAEPLRMLRDDELIYVSDGNYTIDACYLTYIKSPVEVSYSGAITSDLPSTVHHKLADMTAQRMLENIESSRYTTFTNETLTIP